MILDPSGIMKSSGIVKNANMVKEHEAEVPKISSDEKERALLLFYAGKKSLKAVPLEHVSRLEEIDLAAVEWAGQQRVIQYGNTLIPLYLLDLKYELPTEGRRPVIVFSTRNGFSGLIVDKILDITSFTGEYQISSEDQISGSAIIKGQTTEIIDLHSTNQKPSSHNGNGAITEILPVIHNGANGDYQRAIQ